MAEELPEVLLVSGRFQVRGSSMQTINLARHLPQVGFTGRIVCSDARQLPPDRRAELNVTEIGQLDVPLLRPIVRRLFLRELRRKPPVLVHVQQRSALPFGQWLAMHLNRPLVVSIHDYLASKEVLQLDPVWGRGVIAVSDSVRTELIEQVKLSEHLVRVIHSGVEPPSEETLRPTFGVDQTPVVGTAGPLEAAKGLHFFLRAIPRVLAAHRPVEFLIAGAGPEEHTLRRLAEDLGVTEFLTFVPNVFDLSTSLSAMDIYCLPSIKQGLGTIMLEAMARGRPVIASKVGGAYGVVTHDETGLLVPPSDSDALSNAIIKLLLNPQRAQEIGRAARERVLTDFPVSRMVEQTAALYRDVLAEGAVMSESA
ncbi:MAG: glycosyltransferase family 4 protein [Planctomycetaceae bacterium]|nr:glycosyltransferase family 4 protein [Planctomycetaceae bacterium]